MTFLAIVAACWLLSLVFLAYLIATAPEGYEDREIGFVIGRRSEPAPGATRPHAMGTDSRNGPTWADHRDADPGGLAARSPDRRLDRSRNTEFNDKSGGIHRPRDLK